MLFEKNWIRRRWWDSRTGHTYYLMFALTFINFVLISYRFLIENEAATKSFLSDLWIFIVILIITYVPVSTLIGSWHRRTQLSVETTLKRLEDPLFAKMIRTVLDVQTGKATKEEIEKMKELLLKIEKDKKF